MNSAVALSYNILLYFIPEATYLQFRCSQTSQNHIFACDQLGVNNLNLKKNL